MSDPKCARMLLQAAERDLEALQVMRRSDKVSDEVFGFHVQQAAEKSLKAWLASLGEVYPLTHNLDLLLDLLEYRGIATKPFRKLSDFTPYAVEFRYAGMDSSAESIDRKSAVTLVESLLRQVRLELATVEGP